jgi:hypothetical protein
MAAPRWGDGSLHKVDPEIRQRVRDTVRRELSNAQATEQDLDHALTLFDAGMPLPIVDADKFSEIRRWLRRFGNEEVLALAASLWTQVMKGQRGVTLRWLANDFLGYDRDVKTTGDELEWQAETLAARAKEAGLLARSTEWNDPRTYAFQDEQVNPGFDIGPMVWQIGRLVQNFQRTSEGL